MGLFLTATPAARLYPKPWQAQPPPPMVVDIKKPNELYLNLRSIALISTIRIIYSNSSIGMTNLNY